jgi:hypothetical protein
MHGDEVFPEGFLHGAENPVASACLASSCEVVYLLTFSMGKSKVQERAKRQIYKDSKAKI